MLQKKKKPLICSVYLNRVRTLPEEDSDSESEWRAPDGGLLVAAEDECPWDDEEEDKSKHVWRLHLSRASK